MDWLVMTPVLRPCSSAYSSRVLVGAPSLWPLTASGPWLMTPLRVFTPVTIDDMPFAESETKSSTGEVSLSPRYGHC